MAFKQQSRGLEVSLDFQRLIAVLYSTSLHCEYTVARKMASPEVKKSTVDEADHPSDRSPSTDEKLYENGAPVAVIDVPDPDEGLSDEERKKIVGSQRSPRPRYPVPLIPTLSRTASCCGSWTYNSSHGLHFSTSSPSSTERTLVMRKSMVCKKT